MNEKPHLNLSKIATVVYILGLVCGIVFVRQTLATKNVDVITKGQVELKPEVKKLMVNLTVTGGQEPSNFKYEMTSADSVYDLLQQARKLGTIYFETIEYNDRFDIKFLDKLGTTQYKANLFLNGDSVMSRLKQTELSDGQTYTLKLMK